MELDSSNARNNVFSWVIFVIYLLINVLIFAITYAKYYQGERNKFKKNIYFKKYFFFENKSILGEHENPRELLLK